MTWNYRLTKRKEGDEDVYAVREVYYDDKGEIDGWTEEAVYPCGASWEEFQNDLARYQRGAVIRKSQVLDIDSLEALTPASKPPEGA